MCPSRVPVNQERIPGPFISSSPLHIVCLGNNYSANTIGSSTLDSQNEECATCPPNRCVFGVCRKLSLSFKGEKSVHELLSQLIFLFCRLPWKNDPATVSASPNFPSTAVGVASDTFGTDSTTEDGSYFAITDAKAAAGSAAPSAAGMAVGTVAARRRLTGSSAGPLEPLPEGVWGLAGPSGREVAGVRGRSLADDTPSNDENFLVTAARQELKRLLSNQRFVVASTGELCS